MTKIEMNRRLDTMSDSVIAQIRDLIKQGYGANGIRFEVNANIKQINAVFASMSN